MNKKRIEISQLISFLGTELIRVEGDSSFAYIDNIPDPAHVEESSC